MSPERDHLSENDLHLFLDDALDPAARRAARIHLDRCRSCADRLSQAEALFAAIEAWEDLPLRRDLSPAIVAEIAPAPVGLRVATVIQAGVAVLVTILAWPLAEALVATIQIPTSPFLPPGAVEMTAALLSEALAAAQVDLAANLSLAVETLRNVPGWLTTWPLLVGGALSLALIGNSILLSDARRPAAMARRL